MSPDSPELREETAIWGPGTTNSLLVLRAMFTWQLADDRS
jgi:hypothetical protein